MNTAKTNKGNHSCKLPAILLAAVCGFAWLSSDAQTTFTWNGGGASNNFSDTNNWGGANGNQHGILSFAGTTRLEPFADGTGTLNTHRLYFLDGAGAFVISGRDIGLNDHGGADPTIRNLSTNVQTIMNNIIGDSTVGTAASGDPLRIQANEGDIIMMGNITNRGSPLVISGGSASRYVAIGGNVSGNPNIEIDSAQLRILEGGSINDVVGSIFVGNGGTTNTAASLIIADLDGGSTVSKIISVNGGNGTAFSRMVGASNTNGINTFSGNIVRGASGNRNTTLAQTGGGTVDFNGVISGDHRVIIEGPGTVRFGGINTYAAQTEINSGELHVKEGAVIAASGQLVYVGNGLTPATSAGLFIADIDGGTTVGHEIRINPGEDSNRTVGGLNTSGTNTFSGAIVMSGSGNRDATLYAETGGTVAFTGEISGTGQITKEGGGIVDLTSANTYTGGTVIAAGTLRLNNASGSGTGTGNVTLKDGGTLGGTGRLSTVSFLAESNSVVAPGNSLGELTIDLSLAGTAEFEAGAMFAFDLGDGGLSDLLRFTGSGNVIFNNNQINFVNIGMNGLDYGTYLLMTFEEGMDVDGNLVIGSGLEEYEGSTLSFNGNSLELNVVPEPSSLLALMAGLAVWMLRRRGNK